MTVTLKLGVNHYRHGKPVTITGTVRVEIDDPGLAQLIAEKALCTYGGKARLLKGLVKAKVLAWEKEPLP